MDASIERMDGWDITKTQREGFLNYMTDSKFYNEKNRKKKVRAFFLMFRLKTKKKCDGLYEKETVLLDKMYKLSFSFQP